VTPGERPGLLCPRAVPLPSTAAPPRTSSPARAGGSGALHRLHVPHDRLAYDLRPSRRAALHELAASFIHRDVAGRQVEGLAGLEHLIVVGEAIARLAFEHVAPVRTRAAVVG